MMILLFMNLFFLFSCSPANLSYLDATNVPAPEVPDEMVRLFERMCKKFRFLFSPSNFANPSLKAFYAQIEALVFDENEPEVGDDTLPDVAHQDGVMEAFIQEFHDLFEKVSLMWAVLRFNTDIWMIYCVSWNRFMQPSGETMMQMTEAVPNHRKRNCPWLMLRMPYEWTKTKQSPFSTWRTSSRWNERVHHQMPSRKTCSSSLSVLSIKWY